MYYEPVRDEMRRVGFGEIVDGLVAFIANQRDFIRQVTSR